jgi:hypothetical protein
LYVFCSLSVRNAHLFAVAVDVLVD